MCNWSIPRPVSCVAPAVLALAAVVLGVEELEAAVLAVLAEQVEVDQAAALGPVQSGRFPGHSQSLAAAAT